MRGSMKEDYIKNLIRAWRERSHNEGDQFASFVFIWFCFNAWLEFLSSAKTDRKMLEELKAKLANMNSFVKAYEAASSDEFFKLENDVHRFCNNLSWMSFGRILFET